MSKQLIDMVRDEAAKVNHTVTDSEAHDILWNHTGYPSFYMGDDPLAYFTKQVSEFFAGKRSCCYCGDKILGCGFSIDCRACEKCEPGSPIVAAMRAVT